MLTKPFPLGKKFIKNETKLGIFNLKQRSLIYFRDCLASAPFLNRLSNEIAVKFFRRNRFISVGVSTFL